jgi:hypothetical protein
MTSAGDGEMSQAALMAEFDRLVNDLARSQRVIHTLNEKCESAAARIADLEEEAQQASYLAEERQELVKRVAELSDRVHELEDELGGYKGLLQGRDKEDDAKEATVGSLNDQVIELTITRDALLRELQDKTQRCEHLEAVMRAEYQHVNRWSQTLSNLKRNMEAHAILRNDPLQADKILDNRQLCSGHLKGIRDSINREVEQTRGGAGFGSSVGASGSVSARGVLESPQPSARTPHTRRLSVTATGGKYLDANGGGDHSMSLGIDGCASYFATALVDPLSEFIQFVCQLIDTLNEAVHKAISPRTAQAYAAAAAGQAHAAAAALPGSPQPTPQTKQLSFWKKG